MGVHIQDIYRYLSISIDSQMQVGRFQQEKIRQVAFHVQNHVLLFTLHINQRLVLGKLPKCSTHAAWSRQSPKWLYVYVGLDNERIFQVHIPRILVQSVYTNICVYRTYTGFTLYGRGAFAQYTTYIPRIYHVYSVYTRINVCGANTKVKSDLWIIYLLVASFQHSI